MGARPACLVRLKECFGLLIKKKAEFYVMYIQYLRIIHPIHPTPYRYKEAIKKKEKGRGRGEELGCMVAWLHGRAKASDLKGNKNK